MTYDVVVAGGGPAGFGAAVASARNSARVLLIEGTNCLGGMLTNGLVGMIRTAGERGGIVRELIDRLIAVGGASETATHVYVAPGVARTVTLEMALEAGVKVLFHTMAAGVEIDGQTVRAVRLANKGGIQSAHCGIAIDATGDGDLAAWAGAPFAKGGDDGRLQAVSLNFDLAGVDLDKRPPLEEFKRICADALRRGEIDLPPPHQTLAYGFVRPIDPPGYLHFQYDMAFGIDASNALSLSEGEILCHRKVLRIWEFLRNRFSAYRNSVVVNVANYLGVRETRRIEGLQRLEEADILEARKHPDGIARGSWYMDVHDGIQKTPQYKKALSVPENDYYEIPYGCLVPRTVDGLLVAGRCISSTRMANGSLRLQITCMNLGQAAGTAAAVCVQRGISPRQMRGADLRDLLKRNGMDL
ncbi:MAG: FAD-dependent oxidoreductase [Kiritimatiellae bacterium]|nr:FAD-dependent oxidoreductase [Kiritimatiellia bacterium]